MGCHTAATAVLSVLLVGVVATSAQAETPQVQPQLRARAAELHRQAVNLYKDGALDDAITEWAAAERLHPRFKYAFNLALAYMDGRDWTSAWDAMLRAESYGAHPRYDIALATMRERLRDELLQQYAQLEVRVRPSEARVTRNGSPWTGPRSVWVRRGTSVIVVELAGHVTSERTVEHAPGESHRLEIRLSPQQLASAGPGLPHATASAGAPSAAGSGAGLAPWGWTAVGAAAAAGVGTAVALVLADDAARDLRSLNGGLGGSATYGDYTSRYAALRREHRDLHTAGVAAAAVGSALLVTGVTLLIVDGVAEEPAEADVADMPAVAVGVHGGGPYGSLSLRF